MKALSVRPGPAEAIADGSKRIENRSWATKHRGPLAIHRSGKQGAIIAVCEVVDCVNLDEVIEAGEEGVAPPWEEDQDEHAIGKYCWLLENVQRVDPPIPAKGQLGLWTVDEAIARKLEAQLRE